MPSVVGKTNTRAVFAPIALYGTSAVIVSKAGIGSGRGMELYNQKPLSSSGWNRVKYGYMDRQPSAPGASAISEGSGNLGVLAFPSIKPSSSRLFAQVRTADAGIAGQPDQWHMQPFHPARSWVTPQSTAHVPSQSAYEDSEWHAG